ncbi:hypothetical protein BGZ59_003730 [Podila verticillata]|nr:hypothetical protein BGZ59_003730 [Podila verticillata]
MDQQEIVSNIAARAQPTMRHVAKGHQQDHQQELGFQSEHPMNASQSDATFMSSRRRRRSVNVVFRASEDNDVSFTQPGSNANITTTLRPAISILRKMTPDRGRIMLTQTSIRKGTFLFQTTAHAAICDADRRKIRCGSCFGEIKHGSGLSGPDAGGRRDRTEEGGASCELCNEIWYCDQSCREQDWHSHQFECEYLGLLYKDNHTQHANKEQWQEAAKEFRGLDPYAQDYTRCLIRVLVHRFNELQATSTASKVPSSQTADPSDPEFDEQDETPLPFSRIWDLVENREAYTQDKLEHEMKPVARILDAFQDHYCSRYSTPPRPVTGQGATPTGATLTLDELLGLICREECNSFGLYSYPHTPWNTQGRQLDHNNSDGGVDNSKQGYALGLFARGFLSSFNHSCSPNVYHAAHKKYLLFFAACDIAAGEELNIFYLEVGPRYRAPLPLSPKANQDRLEAFKTRKMFLKSHFHFDCGCERCRWEERLQETAGGPVAGMDQERERFLSVGLICAREGCYGFYAPPTVLKVMLENDAVDESQWGCVACGHLQ